MDSWLSYAEVQSDQATQVQLMTIPSLAKIIYKKSLEVFCHGTIVTSLAEEWHSSKMIL